ncbi:glutathione S-transferase 1-like [Anoplophora glabripennis]|uniref:glutathione S-transferase 1-like n=1 Tax=Anoplophora glabripennis TaxID=217634 RepID=UPI0008745F39|nr:glutathione S-transferase 1-like [Anoplophora glabripennis]
MPITVYGMNASPVVRGTLMAVEALGLEFERIEVNTMLGDQFKPEFLKLNPLHTIPTIQDGDFVIWDSHAINSYLVDKYGKDDSFYPKDLQKRAVINQRLYFDCVLFPKILAVFSSIKNGAVSVRKDLADPLIEAYTSLETLLARSTYAAGEQVTIADFSLVATISSANVVVPVESSQFPRTTEWLTKMQDLPYYHAGNQVGLDRLIAAVKNKFTSL